MMFLEFFIWGAWLPLIFAYLPALGFTPLQIGLILATFNVAALVGMFFSNQFADRTFAAEKFLAFSHLIGGLAIGALFWLKGPTSKEFPTVMAQLYDPAFLSFFGLMLIHSLLYVPTISITNSIAFANLQDPQKEFGPVRLWGTIGWIAAAWPFVFILTDWDKVPAFGSVGFVEWLGAALGTPKSGEAMIAARASTFLAAGIASVVLAVFSLTLPHTPPKVGSGTESLAWLEALKLLRFPFLLVLFIVTFIDAAVHQYYFFWTPGFLENVGVPGNWITPVMSIGQIAEILTMAILGLVLKNFGWRATMIVGVLGHAARFGVFAFLPNRELVIAVNVLHGICYAFFFATVYIFVDEYFPKDVRASAQGLFNLLILGVGPLFTNLGAPYLASWFKIDDVKMDYYSVFLLPAGASLVAAILLLLFFHPPKSKSAAETSVG
ncbi:MAG: MFS transporter [Planctomycetia bacterium]|nr:MFS transporter [Planctomycetia bacterium]